MAPIRTIWPAIGESRVKNGTFRAPNRQQSFGEVNGDAGNAVPLLCQIHTGSPRPH